jgi:hypothetical protein
MLDMSEVMTQTKRDTLVLKVVGWSVRLTVTSVKKKQLIVEKPNNGCQMDIGKRPGKIIFILVFVRW